MEQLETQQQADMLFRSVDWEHAFIREAAVRSLSYSEGDGAVVSPDCLPTVDLVVATPSDMVGGLRLRLEGAEELVLSFTGDVQLSVVISRSYVEVRLSGERLSARCKQLWVERLPAYGGSDYLLLATAEP